jgi:hypothetical protein
MKYLVATSDKPYYHWQLLVQYNNFKKLGIEKDLIWVYSFDDNISDEMKSLILGCKVKAYGVKDTRKYKNYTCSLTGFVLSEVFKQIPELCDETFFYIDPDVLLSKKIITKKMINNKIWYLSDTKSYLDSKYIKSKSVDLFNEMCDIVGIDPKIVEKNDLNAGGAQYLLKNVDSKFWEKVYDDCEKLYKHMSDTEHLYCPEHPIQKWTAEMWAVLWNCWLFGHKSKIIKELNFSWATDNISNVEKLSIYHNAGVVDQKDLFNKGSFANKHPFNENFDYVDKNRGSYFYITEILNTKNNFPEIIKKLK